MELAGIRLRVASRSARMKGNQQRLSPTGPYPESSHTCSCLKRLAACSGGTPCYAASSCFSHLHTRPSSGSMTSPTRRKPHLVKTRVRFRARVYPDRANLAVAESVGDQGSCRFCGVSLALIIGSDAIGNLDNAVGCWGALEATAADHGVTGPQYQGKSM